ncbi:hypothetical protein CHELA20_30038 [Hyphomicrobiales bacterium]|nr:hypothetical protein CHELA20_30038 [Hyphomicrobiales bacterium]
MLQVERLRAIGFGDAGISDQHVSQTFDYVTVCTGKFWSSKFVT